MKKKGIVTLLTAAGLTAVLAAVMCYAVLKRAESKGDQKNSGVAAQTEHDGQDSAGMTDIPGTAGDEAGWTVITLRQDGTTIAGDGVTVTGNRVAIQQGGTFLLSGSLEDGQVYVEAGNNDTVILLFAGVDITNFSEAAVYIEKAGNTSIILAEGSENRLQSGETTEIHAEDAEIDGSTEGSALYARDDLTLSGNGILRVFGYVNNGIHTRNNLRLEGGTIFVEALNNGMKGKDSITVIDGTFSIISGGDGLKADDTTGEGYGVITIKGGSFSIESGGDGMQAETVLDISDGDFTVLAGGGSSDVTYPSDRGWGRADSGWDMEAEEESSTKGFKSGREMKLSGGVFWVDSRDDGFHSNGSVTISGGNYQISTGDDGIHADTELIIEDGSVKIGQAYEGLEANQIHILGGEITVVSADDGINAYGGQSRWGWEDSGKTTDETPNLHIAGGTVSINADGDGIDSNGNITIEGGTLTVDGPTSNWNGAIDSGSENGGTCTVDGGTILAIGSSGMAETFSERSGQYSFRHNFDTAFAAGDEIAIIDRQGNVLCSHTAAKGGSSVVFSCSELTGGETYTLKAGVQEAEIVLNSISTRSGRQGGWGW